MPQWKDDLRESRLMPRRNIVILAVLILLVSREGNAQDQPVKLCALLANASRYDGREVVVSRQFRSVIHGSILFEPLCSSSEVNLRDAPNYTEDHNARAIMRKQLSKDRFQAVQVVLRGVFRVAHQGECFGQNCWAYEIEISQLLSAHALTGQ
jgi:hypothetical protein